MGQYRSRRKPVREKVVAELRKGPVEDEKGRVLMILADRVGHHSSMSVGNVIRELEAEGLATRVNAKDGVAPRDIDGNPSPHVRRTYRVALTDEYIASLPPIVAPKPEVEVTEVEVTAVEEPAMVAPVAEVESDTEETLQLPEGLDYDLLAHAVFGVAAKNLVASQEVQDVRAVRKELDEMKARVAVAEEVIKAQGAELKEERKQRGRIEDEAAKLSLQVEELQTELEAAGRPALNNGWQKVPVDARKELVKMMTAIPNPRG